MRVHGWCDRARVAQVLRILLDNAVTHTPNGTGIALSVLPDGDGCTLTVRDTGPGIPRAELATVFEPFSTSDGRTGSGLGLAIARELAGLMGGRLALTSSPAGTTLTFHLPLGEPAGGR